MAFGTYSAAVAALTIGSTVYSGIEYVLRAVRSWDR